MADRILVVDDDPALRSLLKLVAVRAGFEVDTARDGVEALQKLAANEYLIAVIDLMMPRVSGYDVVERLSAFERRPAILVVTAMADAHVPRLDGRIVNSILRKPFDIDMFSAVLTELAKTLRSSHAGGNVIEFPGQGQAC